ERLPGGERGDPERRPRLLRRTRQRCGVFEAVEAPLRRDFFRLEQAAPLLESLLETRSALVHRNAEAGKLVRQESTGKPHLQPAGGNRINHPDLARKLQRVVEHRQHRAGDQTHGARQCRRGGKEDEWVGTVAAIGQEIVLDRAHIGKAQLLGELGELERLAPILVGGLLVRTDGGKELNAEFHRSPVVAQSSMPMRRSSEKGPPPRSAMAKQTSPHSRVYS